MIIQVVRLLLGERDDETSISRRDRGRVIPFQVIRFPVVEVNGFPVWVVSRIEGATVDVELVREYEL